MPASKHAQRLAHLAPVYHAKLILFGFLEEIDRLAREKWGIMCASLKNSLWVEQQSVRMWLQNGCSFSDINDLPPKRKLRNSF